MWDRTVTIAIFNVEVVNFQILASTDLLQRLDTRVILSSCPNHNKYLDTEIVVWEFFEAVMWFVVWNNYPKIKHPRLFTLVTQFQIKQYTTTVTVQIYKN